MSEVLLVRPDLLKAHIESYTRSDGTFVQAHEDKRQSAAESPASPARLTPEQIAQKQAEIAAQKAKMRADHASKFPERLASIPSEYLPSSPVGENFAGFAGDTGKVAPFFGLDGKNAGHLLKSMIADYGGGEKFTIQIASSSESALTIIFRGSGGTHIEREFVHRGDGITATHRLFKAAKTGSGSAKNLLRCTMGSYHALGVDRVELNANIDVGGYAWARFGFLPNNWNSVKKAIQKNLASIQSGQHKVSSVGPNGKPTKSIAAPIAPEHEAAIARILESKDPRTLWTIADMRVNGRPVGKELLLGSKWLGGLDIDDKHSMDRFNSYIAGK